MAKTTKKSPEIKDLTPISCWIITEGMAGTENQCIAVAEALGCNFTKKHIGLKFPYNHLSPFIFKSAPQNAITGIDWNAPLPDLIIASGRKAVPVTLCLTNIAKEKNTYIKTVFIQAPKISTNHFDIVAAPMHDEVKGDNVIHTHAAPNRITSQLLEEAKTKFNFPSLPQKKIAVLIGGNSKTHTMPDRFAQDLFGHVMPFMRTGEYGLMITASRRTPDNIRTQLNDMFHDDNCVFWDGEGDNPYHAYLAHADHIFVTEDSTSMLSDALSTGKPTYRLPLNGGSEKFNRLYQNLKRRCMLKVFDGDLKNWDYRALNDAKKIADKIRTDLFA